MPCFGLRSAMSGLIVVGMLAASPRAMAAAPSVAQCLSANEEAIALETRKSLRAARAQLVVCSAKTCPSAVRAECSKRLALVTEATPRARFEVVDVAGHPQSDVVISMDGKPFLDGLEDGSVSVDPGEHRFVLTSRGATTERVLVFREGEKDRHIRVVLDVPSRGVGAQRALGMTLTGVGGLALVATAVFTAVALATVDSHCDSTPVGGFYDCQQGPNLLAPAIFLTASGTATVLGIVLWATAPSEGSSPSAAMQLGPTGLRFGSTW